MKFVLILGAAIVYTEFVGYWLHILLHSEKVPWLSRAHMLHHLRDYGPKKPLHRDTYFSSASTRFSLLGVGMEWFLPGLLIIGTSLVLLHLLGLGWFEKLLFAGTGILWGHFLFGYMHSSMHLNHFWMRKVPVLGPWYLRARKLHDFHHLQLSADGRMLKNYGICFFWFDRIFGSFSPAAEPFDQKGYQAALVRYRNVLQEGRPG